MINAFKQIRLTNVNISGKNGRLEIANSGSLAFSSELAATGSSLQSQIDVHEEVLDTLWGANQATEANFAAVASNLSNLSSGLDSVSAQLPFLNVSVQSLSSGVSQAFEVIENHQTRIDSLEEVVGVLVDEIGAEYSSDRSFSYLIPSGTEETTVLFPGNPFENIPVVTASLESEVGYMFSIRNKTVSGFFVSFSDVIQEDNVYLNVSAADPFLVAQPPVVSQTPTPTPTPTETPTPTPT